VTEAGVPLMCPRCNGPHLANFYLPDGSASLRCQECGKEFKLEAAKVYKARTIWLLNPEIR
jgi:uncharacterized protein (DUF983 family)